MDKFVEEFLVKPTFDHNGEQVSAAIGRDGKEYGDPVPMAPPIGYKPPDDINTLIRRLVHSEMLARKLEEEGLETFEEADDFDIEDDPLDPLTPYEKVFEAPAVGDQGGGAVKPTADAAPAVEVSKPVVSDVKPLSVATREASVSNVDKSEKDS